MKKLFCVTWLVLGACSPAGGLPIEDGGPDVAVEGLGYGSVFLQVTCDVGPCGVTPQLISFSDASTCFYGRYTGEEGYVEDWAVIRFPVYEDEYWTGDEPQVAFIIKTFYEIEDEVYGTATMYDGNATWAATIGDEWVPCHVTGFNGHDEDMAFDIECGYSSSGTSLNRLDAQDRGRYGLHGLNGMGRGHVEVHGCEQHDGPISPWEYQTE